jgi:hypothetical protein
MLLAGLVVEERNKIIVYLVIFLCFWLWIMNANLTVLFLITLKLVIKNVKNVIIGARFVMGELFLNAMNVHLHIFCMKQNAIVIVQSIIFKIIIQVLVICVFQAAVNAKINNIIHVRVAYLHIFYIKMNVYHHVQIVFLKM